MGNVASVLGTMPDLYGMKQTFKQSTLWEDFAIAIGNLQ